MTTPQIKLVNAETGEEIERDMNPDELAQHKIDVARLAADVEAKKSKAVEKAALLEKLGITADEAKLLLS